MNMFSLLLSVEIELLKRQGMEDVGWWERRAMDAVSALALCIVVFAIGCILGLIKRAKRHKNKSATAPD